MCSLNLTSCELEMRTERLTAFSDGVIAIIITIMVLELKAPHDAELVRAASARADFSSAYCAELRLCGDLLEQPSSPDARRAMGEWRNPLDQSDSAVLSLAHSLFDGLAQRDGFRASPNGALRPDAARTGDGLLRALSNLDRFKGAGA